MPECLIVSEEVPMNARVAVQVRNEIFTDTQVYARVYRQQDNFILRFEGAIPSLLLEDNPYEVYIPEEDAYYTFFFYPRVPKKI